MVRHSCRGFSSTVLAFGQTGAGKSHTIFGDDVGGRDDALSGLLPQAVTYMFSKLRKLVRPYVVALRKTWFLDRFHIFFMDNSHYFSGHYFSG